MQLYNPIEQPCSITGFLLWARYRTSHVTPVIRTSKGGTGYYEEKPASKLCKSQEDYSVAKVHLSPVGFVAKGQVLINRSRPLPSAIGIRYIAIVLKPQPPLQLANISSVHHWIVAGTHMLRLYALPACTCHPKVTRRCHHTLQ